MYIPGLDSEVHLQNRVKFLRHARMLCHYVVHLRYNCAKQRCSKKEEKTAKDLNTGRYRQSRVRTAIQEHGTQTRSPSEVANMSPAALRVRQTVETCIYVLTGRTISHCRKGGEHVVEADEL